MLVAVVAVFVPILVPIEERNLFYLAPLFCIAPLA
jgi:hypothetical protein